MTSSNFAFAAAVSESASPVPLAVMDSTSLPGVLGEAGADGVAGPDAEAVVPGIPDGFGAADVDGDADAEGFGDEDGVDVE